MNDSITQMADSLGHSVTANPSCTEFNIWKIISIILIVLCIVELILIIYEKNKRIVQPSSKDRLRQKVRDDGDIDFGNIMNSAFLSDRLYHELIKRCHPDLFATNPIKLQIATDLSQRITQNKVNYRVLQDLKKEAEEKLNIQFRL